MPKNSDTVFFKAQKGPQEDFLASPADILVFGGAAGGGKTWGLLLDFLRLAWNHPNINGVIFRGDSGQLLNPGSVWPVSYQIYGPLGCKPNITNREWTFPNGSRLKFASLRLESDKYKWDGTNLDWIAFDEATFFTQSQVFHLFGRLRSTTGAFKPYLRLTCNPDPESWLKHLVDQGWILPTGLGDRKRSGILKWFIRENDNFHWANSKEEMDEIIIEMDLDKETQPISFTFIPSDVEDNKILLQSDPSYIARLAALDHVEKQRKLFGNWYVKHTGKIFLQQDFKIFVNSPPTFKCILITVDTAQGLKEKNDFTVMQVWGEFDNKIYLLAQSRGKFDFSTQINVLYSLVINWNPNWVCIELKANGHALTQEIRRRIAVPLIDIPRVKDKYSRARDVEGYVQSGYVYINPSLDYYSSFISEVTAFDGTSGHDDQVDCLIDAIYMLLFKKISRHLQNVCKEAQSPSKTLLYNGKYPRHRSVLRSATDR